MRRATVLLSALIALLALAPAAQGGTAIKHLSACPNSYLYYTGASVSRPDYRTALLCLINAARKAEGLPALVRSAPLETVGQAQSDKFARTGSGSHGNSVTDITKRFAQHGYKAAAYNEGFSVLNPGASPYDFLVDLLERSGVPCTEVLDPRFRDIGIGVSLASQGGVPEATTLALEFGLRSGQRQPSTNTGPASGCGHKVPPAQVSGEVALPRGNPVETASTITVTIQCTAKQACALTAQMALPDAHATAGSGQLMIPPGKSLNVTFTFDPAALAAERKASQPGLKLTFLVTEPAQYTDAFNAPL
jgi:uncharacterized protein YkwD